MSLQPIPSEFESQTNATYEALMWALSRPGSVRRLPISGLPQILLTLVDRECAVHCPDPDLAAVAARTGAALVGLEAADHVFPDASFRTDLLRHVCCGSDLYPDLGATLVLEADLHGRDRLRLSGPGVEGTHDVSIGGLPEGFWHERARVMRYPMGFEIFLIDADRVMGIPRSTRVEVL